MSADTFAARLLRACTLATALLCAAGHAQNVILSPAVVPLSGQAGQSITQALTLQNGTDQALEFTLEARDVIVRDGKRVFVEAGQLPDSIAATAIFSPRSVRIEPRSSATVNAMMTLPTQVRHRAAVAYFRGTNLVQSGSRKATVSLGTLFTFSLSDRTSVRAGELVTTPPSASGNAQVTVQLVNDGEEPVVPTGMAVFLDAQGKLAGKAPFRARRLLPGEVLDLQAEYTGELAPGAYRTVATLEVAGRPLTLTATLTVQ